MIELNTSELNTATETNNIGDSIDALRITKSPIDTINACMIPNKKRNQIYQDTLVSSS